MFKKITTFFMVFLIVFSFAACGSNETQSQETAPYAEPAPTSSVQENVLATPVPQSFSEDTKQDDNGDAQKIPETIDVIPVILNQDEYLLYQNIFYNEYGDQFVGKSVTKTGVFATIYDAFNQKTRYYVWGYLDNTRCCDWQWEIVPVDGAELPPNGSIVDVNGVFSKDENALDGYWIIDAKVSPVSKFTGNNNEIEMCTMSGTLERVQIANIFNFPEEFEGKTFSAYGRVEDIGMLQDPYYDGSWQISFSTSGDMPAIGESIQLYGTVQDGVLADCSISPIE